jgi:hypothetical protein
MRLNDQEKSFRCQTLECIASRSNIDLVEFYSQAKGILYSQAVTELSDLEIVSEDSRPERLTSKGFATSEELLDFHKKTQPDYSFVSQHAWHTLENRVQTLVFRFQRRPDVSQGEPELILYGHFFRGKWFRLRVSSARSPAPYNWHLNRRSRSLLICRNELEADFAQGHGIAAIAVSPLGDWDARYADYFRSLDVRVLTSPDSEGKEYFERIKRDIAPIASSLFSIEIPRFDLSEPSPESLFELSVALDGPWEKPELSWSAFEAIPTFDPEEMLPESIRYHLLDLSEDLQCPIDMLAAPALSGLSTLVGRKLTVQPKPLTPDFKVAAPLWCVLIADPGQKKTQILKSALAPLFAIEDALEPENRSRSAIRVAEMKLLIAKERDLESRLSDAVRKGNQEQEKQLLENLANVEVERTKLASTGPRQIVLRDVTPEKALEILVQNPEGCMNFADEIPGWWRSLATNHIDMRKLVLEGWGGLKINVQRKSYSIRGESILSVVGGAQPDWISSVISDLKNGGKENDGLINRFSLLINHEPVLQKWEYVDRAPNPQAKSWYDTIFGAFHELRTDQILENWKPGESNAIRFDADAQDEFVSWITAKENAIREGEYPRLLASHISKYTTLYASLALVFHIILFFEGKTEISHEISIHASKLARKWCDYLFHHARRTLTDVKSYPLPVRQFASMVLNNQIKNGALLLDVERIKSLHWRNGRDRKKALKFFEEKKLIRIEESGRQQKIRFNPYSLEFSKNLPS